MKQKREELLSRRKQSFEGLGTVLAIFSFIVIGVILVGGLTLYGQLHAIMIKDGNIPILACLAIIDIISIYLFLFWINGEEQETK